MRRDISTSSISTTDRQTSDTPSSETISSSVATCVIFRSGILSGVALEADRSIPPVQDKQYQHEHSVNRDTDRRAIAASPDERLGHGPVSYRGGSQIQAGRRC